MCGKLINVINFLLLFTRVYNCDVMKKVEWINIEELNLLKVKNGQNKNVSEQICKKNQLKFVCLQMSKYNVNKKKNQNDLKKMLDEVQLFDLDDSQKKLEIGYTYLIIIIIFLFVR